MLTRVQQKAVNGILNAIAKGENIIISSTAGSGKTFVVVSTANQMPFDMLKSVCAITYNRDAADEMIERIPVGKFKEINTIHSVGNRIKPRHKGWVGSVAFWYAANITGYNPKADPSKEKTIAWFVASNAADLSEKMKQEMSTDAVAILEKYDSVKSILYKEDHGNQICNIASDIVATTERRFLSTGKIDFVDMVYLPVILGLRKKFDAVIVDEAQDITPLYMAFVQQCLQPDSIVFVGDAMQAINIWNGAIAGLFDALDWRTIRLANTHRNGVNGCTYVRDRFNVDHFPADNVKQNDVVATAGSLADALKMVDNATIMSRTNAALVPAWHSAVSMGKNAKILGDKKMIGTLQKMITKYSDYASREDTDPDMLATAKAILEIANFNVKKAKNVIASMITKVNNGQGYLLSTVHKQKGKTCTNSILLDNLYDNGQTHEETCIRFVACTRQTDALIIVEPERSKSSIAK